MEFRVLGSLAIVGRDGDVTLTSRVRRRLLTVLLARAGETVPEGQLIDAVWKGTPPPSARSTLQSHVSRLRRTLREHDGAKRIATRPTGYALQLTDVDEVDARTFEHELAEAEACLASRPAVSGSLVDRALGRWRGPAFADVDDADVVRAEAARFEGLRRQAMDLAAEVRLVLGPDPALVSELQAQAEERPLDEAPVHQLMRALAGSGRAPEALTTYEAFRRRLADELGVDPSPGLSDLHTRVLQQDPSVVPREPTAAGESRQSPPARRVLRSPNAFVGRETDARAVGELLSSTPLVTIVGPGGVGKTRLAMEVAADHTASDTEVRVAALAPVREDSAVDDAIGTALGVIAGGGDLRDRIVAALSGRAVVLVLDNCEHALDAVVDLVAHLLPRCPDLTVLATSRQRLAVDGERLWPLHPLAVPEAGSTDPSQLVEVPAIRLFCDRARAVRPDFQLDQYTARPVAEICRRLDGLPLALELAASRTAGLDVRDLAARLDERFSLLWAGTRGVDGRHRALRETVAWSYDLLDASEARLFARLSVFAGSFTLDAVEEVCAEGGRTSTVDRLAALVDKSMVDRTDDRYTLLETLRTFAAERLAESGETEALCGRHARHFARMAAESDAGVKGSDEVVWVARLDRDLDNLRAAAEWALARGETDLALRLSAPLLTYADARLLDEVTRWAERAAGLPGARTHPLYPVAMGAASRGAGNRGDLDRCVALARAALEAVPDPQDPRRMHALQSLAFVAFYRGQFDEAEELQHQVLDLARAVDDPFVTAYAHVMFSLAATYDERPDDGYASAQQARRTADRGAGPTMQAFARYCLGEALADRDPPRALALLEEALELARTARSWLTEGVTLVSISSLRAEQDDPIAALDAFQTAIGHWRRGGDWTHQWTTVRNLVFLLERLGDDPSAATLIGAVTSTPTGADVYGRDAERLRASIHRLRSRLGSQSYQLAEQRGEDMSDDEAITFAVGVIRAHRAKA